MASSKTFKFKFVGDADGLRKATGDVEKDMSGLGGKMSGSAKKIAGAIAGAFVVDKLLSFGKELYNIGAQADLWDKKAQVVFGDQLGLVQGWADANAGAMGLTSRELTGLSANMADLLVPMGMTRESAAQMSMDVTGLAGALSAWGGGTRSTAEVQEILSKALLGERDALTSLGIKISQAEVDQRALTIAKAEGRDAITDMDKALATQQLIMEKSTDAQTAWADGTFESTKKANELKAMVETLKEKMGSALLPIVQAVTAWLVDSFVPALQTLKEWLWPKLQAAHDALAGWWEANGPAIIGFANAVKDAAVKLGEGIMSMWETNIKPAVDQVKEAFTDLKAKLSEAMTKIKGDGDGMAVNWEKIGRIIGVVIGLIIRGIALFIGSVADMVAKVSAAVGTMQSLWGRAKDAVQSFKDKFSDVKTSIANFINDIKSKFGDMQSKISSATSSAKTAINNLETPINTIKRALQWLKDTYDDVKRALSGKLSIPTPSWPQPPSWMRSVAGFFHAGTHSVPGAPGANVPAILQAGERVSSVAQVRQQDRNGAGGGATIVVNAYGATGREMVAEIERAVRDGARAGWLSAAGVN